ncbi:hypothetical protein DO97_01855 [Neosynechococcus sphagnicola sy1]|uniref:Uncharacterized protein n=2 Tax=Neosynechococcus TaxID=1501143 RepID=A0A098TLD1_9CYAN|nr:hypothetical protein DO97_01855 [Neosynechococcus sphagnicola sy1]
MLGSSVLGLFAASALLLASAADASTAQRNAGYRQCMAQFGRNNGLGRNSNMDRLIVCENQVDKRYGP